MSKKTKKEKPVTYQELEDRFAALSDKTPPSVRRQRQRERNLQITALRKAESTEHERRLEAIRQKAYDRYAKPKRRIPPDVRMARLIAEPLEAEMGKIGVASDDGGGGGGGESKLPVARPMVRAPLAEVYTHALLGRRREEYTTKYKAWKKALESNDGQRNDVTDKLHDELRQIEKDAKIPVQGRQFRTSFIGTRKWRNLNHRDPANPRQRPRIEKYSQGRIKGGRRTRRRRKRKVRKHHKKKKRCR